MRASALAAAQKLRARASACGPGGWGAAASGARSALSSGHHSFWATWAPSGVRCQSSRGGAFASEFMAKLLGNFSVTTNVWIETIALLAHLGVKEQVYKNPSQLSGGQRQRVAIARALANDPLVILADEPTGNLDSASSQNVRSMLQSLTRDMGKTVVAVTHDGSFASGADRRIGIVDGKINNDWRPA